MSAGTEHRCETSTRAALRTLYLHTSSCPPPPESVKILELTSSAHALLLAIVDESPWFGDARTSAYINVLMDRLESVTQLPVSLPTPTCPTCRDAAARVRSDPGRSWTAVGLARSAGFSKRTIERHFAVETGMGVGRWIRLARLNRSLELLARGIPVGEIAVQVGYSTQSAFGVMFKTELGVTPARFFAADRN